MKVFAYYCWIAGAFMFVFLNSLYRNKYFILSIQTFIKKNLKSIAQKTLSCMMIKSEKLPDNLIHTQLIFFGFIFVVLIVYILNKHTSLQLH